MKKIIGCFVLFVLISSTVLFMYFNKNNKVYKENDVKQDYSDNLEYNKEEDMLKIKIDNILDNMTLEEKIGQMMIIDFPEEKEVDYETFLNDIKPGGVILTSYIFNNNTVNDLINLTGTLKEFSDIPLIISVDQEGGRVQRLKYLKDAKDKGIAVIPNMNSIGKLNDINVAFDIGRLIGIELKALGINMDFAPVIDTLYEDSNVIGDRSFGSDANLVSKMGIALSNGLNNQGIISVYKHFPNHGATSTDSHDDLPLLNKTKEQLYDTDLSPFRDAISNNASVIMVGHLLYPKITDKPSSLSKEIINDLLKKELGFEGLVITDSLKMKAIINKYSEKEVYELAINAGVDVLLMPNDPYNAINYIKQSIEEGKITEEQINNSVRKILNMKYVSLSNDKGDMKLFSSSLYKELSEKLLNIKIKD